MTLDPVPAQSPGSSMIEENALKRGLAAAVDLFLINGLAGYLILPALKAAGLTWYMMDVEVLFLVSAVYFIGLWMATGQTIGKKLFGLRVIQLDGYPVGFFGALVRYLGYVVLVSLFFLGTVYIGFLFLSIVMAMVSALFIVGLQRHQALHDIPARTMVIKAR